MEPPPELIEYLATIIPDDEYNIERVAYHVLTLVINHYQPHLL